MSSDNEKIMICDKIPFRQKIKKKIMCDEIHMGPSLNFWGKK